ncbi:MAG: GDP-mannose 4,6-dehydratase [Candidatus Edwardsbacteria bacterium]|nr:GDP-mannose 4,6-dehydratase [Candidatus Edwardsbacteria bacterium]MBU1576290.1 GDP-mannose 4,6-dehydratase [Candidatus Edwardsbacteria bacterium]MBU2463489.1 GDP-mannose 4,6-dehydratase [Candidatus Edwardsbacteria bacterium]MBU2593903.1 GDP-mannose 4,6-dehydratase [Candidatus Edwardsbacteria bacterium]
MRVFITGIEGFVGHHLAGHLIAAGHEVSGSYFDEPAVGDLNGRCTLFRIDLRSGEGLHQALASARPQCLYHLAAQSSPALSFKKPVDTFEINVIGLVNLLEEARNTVPECKVIMVSSCEVYGLTNTPDPVKEDYPYNPASPYAVSKISQEQLAIQYFHTYKMNTVVARPFPHTGPGQPEMFALPSFARQIAGITKHGSDPVVLVGNLSARRDLSDVRDIVRAYGLLAEAGLSGEIYNVCSGKNITIQQALEMLIKISGKKIEVRTDPHRFRPLDIPILWGDNSKIRRQTGWQPEYEIEQTLKELHQYWLDRV